MYKKPVHLGTSWPISTLPPYPAGHGFLCRLIPVFFSCHHSPQRSPLWYSLPAGIWGARYLYPSPRCHFLFPAKPGKFAALAHIVSIFFPQWVEASPAYLALPELTSSFLQRRSNRCGGELAPKATGPSPGYWRSLFFLFYTWALCPPIANKIIY